MTNSADAAKSAADTAAKALEASDRPWLPVESVEPIGEFIQGDTIELPVSVKLLHFGHSPAQQINFQMEIMSGSATNNYSYLCDRTDAHFAKVSKELRARGIDYPEGGEIVFPAETPMTVAWGAARRTNELLCEAGTQIDSKLLVPGLRLAGCISYFSETNPKRLQLYVSYLINPTAALLS